MNVKGTYLMDRSFVPLLLGTGGGLKTVVTVSSIGGLVTSGTASAYQSTKTAQIRLDDFLMAEYGGEVSVDLGFGSRY